MDTNVECEPQMRYMHQRRNVDQDKGIRKTRPWNHHDGIAAKGRREHSRETRDVTTGKLSKNTSLECFLSSLEGREFEQSSRYKSLAKAWSSRSNRHACREKQCLSHSLSKLANHHLDCVSYWYVLLCCLIFSMASSHFELNLRVLCSAPQLKLHIVQFK